MYKFNLIPRTVKKINTPNRKIVTKLPVPESLDIINRSLKYEPQSMNHQVPCIWDKAIGHQVFDPYGNIWIDFSSSIFINNSGHGNSHIISGIDYMLKKPLLSSYSYPTEIRSLLAEKLINMTSSEGMEKVFFLSTGSETNETAIRLSRLYGQKQNKDKNIIVSFDSAFHGRTLGSQMISGNENSTKWVGYNDPNIIHLSCYTNPFKQMEEQDVEDYGRNLFYDDLIYLSRQNIDVNNICAFVFEPYQGWGALFYLTGYIKAMREFADSINALVIADEVQSGFWRVGKLFGYQYYGIKPDIICCGKAISSSLPLSAVLTRKEIMDLDSGLSSTHSGSPIACSATLANLEFMERRNFEREVAYKEGIIKAKLDKFLERYSDRIISYHGKGMAFAMMVVKPNTEILDIDFVDRLVEKCFEKGLILIRTGKGTIKLGMPLTITENALIEGLNVIDEAISELIQEGY